MNTSPVVEQHIAVVGPGAVGGVVAAWLAHTGRYRLTLCARRPLLQELHVDTPAGPLVFNPTVITSPEQASPADWVLITTKAYDAAAAAAWLPGFGATAKVAILQNGIEHRENFSPFVEAARLVPVIVDVPCERTSPFRMRQRAPGKLTVSDDPLGHLFAPLFAGTSFEVSLTADFRSAAWRKLCLNCAGVLSALLLRPAGIMRDEAIGGISRQLVRECIAVGRAEGAVLNDSLVETVLQAYRSAPPDSLNSLHADRAAGRPMEIDARNGVVVRLGRKHGIPTPCNEMAVALLEAMAKS
jgi:2-dehydropantoate 2-reductase